jgi:ATP-binding cassette subfamily F protein uup
MSELILSVEEALILIGGKPFFEDMSFHIHRGRKIALVGKNGAGKTTLMNMISGERELDDGRRWLLQGISIGHMEQNITPIPGQTVGEYVFTGLRPKQEGEWDESYKVELIIEPLGLKVTDRMDSLSGGLLRRAALARALVEEPDILLLDEPTNHMDLEIIEWLEGFLKTYPGAIICVSHDRTFLAKITDNVFWLDRGKLKVSPQGFAYFEEWSTELLEMEARQLHNREKKLELELEWANRGVKARVKRNVRRVRLAREEKAQLEADKAEFRRVTSSISLAAPKSDEDTSLNVAEFFSAGKTFIHPETGEEKVILEKFNLRVRRGERIGILGRNGSGKTTFLKMLIGEMKPDTGKVKLANDLTYGYFDQKRETLQLNKTLQENLCPEGHDHLDVRGKSRHVCGYLKDFLFEPEDAWRAAATLSGGQMNRLMLAKVLANPGSFLILDEPTNDLDMDTLDMLENTLREYDGTLFVVSHDRDFMDQVIDKLLVFEGDGKIETIIGGYSDYIAYKKSLEQKEAKKDLAPAKETKKKTVPDLPKSDKAGDKVSFKIKYEWEQLPEKIKKLEDECAAMEEQLADGDFYRREPDEFYAVSERFTRTKAQLEKAELRWLELDEICAGQA